MGHVLRELAARGPLSSREEDVPIELSDLPGFIDVEDNDDVDGFDTLVMFDDEVNLYADLYADGLDVVLAKQRGIRKVLQEDREVFYLRTRLHLDDVHAAVIRAVVDVNRRPRRQGPREAGLGGPALTGIAAALAPSLEAVGFALRSPSDEVPARYFDRSLEHSIQQVLIVSTGAAQGAEPTRSISLMAQVQLPEGETPSEDELSRWRISGRWTLYHRWESLPTADAATAALHSQVLPWLEHTSSRESLAAWADQNPARIEPPMDRPILARLLARWGYLAAARSILDHIDREWPSLSNERSAREAKEILGGR